MIVKLLSYSNTTRKKVVKLDVQVSFGCDIILTDLSLGLTQSQYTSKDITDIIT